MEQTCVAQWWSPSTTGSPTGTCDDGLGDGYSPYWYSGSSGLDQSGYPIPHYKVEAGGPTVTVTCSPSSTVTGDDMTGETDATVGYAASILDFALTINPGGAVQDSSGNWNILIGKRCSPTLTVTNGYSIVPGSEHWSVTGPTFQNWVSQSAFNLSASYLDDGSGALDVDDPCWYWHEIGDNTSKPETISCTATVTPPAGQGAAFTVSVSQPITVWVPDWTAFGVGGYVRVGIFNANSGYQMYAAPLAANAGTGGMNMAAFVQSPNPSLFGDGSLVLVQLVTPNMSYLSIDLEYSKFCDWSENGQEGLDGGYPYPQYQGSPNYRWRDSPYIGLVDTDVTNVVMDHAFQDYLMYFPPASTQCVPIARFIWDASGKADLPSWGLWSNYASDHGGSDSAGTVTPSGNASLFLPYNEFPMWTQMNGQGGFGAGAPVSSGGF